MEASIVLLIKLFFVSDLTELAGLYREADDAVPEDPVRAKQSRLEGTFVDSLYLSLNHLLSKIETLAKKVTRIATAND